MRWSLAGKRMQSGSCIIGQGVTTFGGMCQGLTAMLAHDELGPAPQSTVTFAVIDVPAAGDGT